MIIAIASDHGGIELKNIIKKYLLSKKIKIKDCGTFTKKSVDYPDFAIKVCDLIKKDIASIGILICGTGIGMSIAANKIKGIRCALCNDVFSAKMSRKHNNANVLAIGARVIGSDLALMLIDVFINNNFEKGRHIKRLKKINNIEKINI